MSRLVWLAFLLICAFAYSQALSQRDVNIVSADGTKLRATFYPVQHPGPAVLLLHMRNTTRKSWDPVAVLLGSQGINALTIDNRGFGESGGPPYESASPDAAAQMQKSWPADFDAAYQHLSSSQALTKRALALPEAVAE